MADASTIARPYAKAVFELAFGADRLEQWGELLTGLGAALNDPSVAPVLNDPRRGGATLAGQIIESLRGHIDTEAENFIRLLAEYGRLNVVSEINERFAALRADAERTIDVEVTSAAPLTEEHRNKLTESLRRRLGRDVRLHVQTDESLIGGAVIRAGDLVIDASMRARIDELAAALNA